MTDSDDKAIRVISFNGKQSEWAIWEEKFLARARRRGYKDIILGKTAVPADSVVIDTTTPAGKEQARVRKLNDVAFEELILSIDTSEGTGKTVFQIIKGCKTNDLKDGDSKTAWTRLCTKFAPKSAPNKLELKLEFNRCTLKSAANDPDEWITNLESIRCRLADMQSTMSDEDLLVHVLNGLPKEYEVQQSKMEDRLGSTSNPLTIQDLRDELNLKFMRMKKSEQDQNGEEADKALSTMGKKSKTKCRHCGKFGHKSTSCWDVVGKPENKETTDRTGTKTGTKFNGNCFYCKKPGHRQVDCRIKKKEETAAASANVTTSDNVVLMANDAKVANCTWIADSGATSHMTNDDKGMYDWKEICQPVKVGNGDEVTAKKIGKLDVVVHNGDGTSTPITLTNVQYVPAFWVKLFSLTAAMANGCEISSVGKKIIVSKDKTKINFDQVINTKNGFILGARMHPQINGITNIAGNEDRVKTRELHCKLGHVSEDATRRTAKFYGWKLSGAFPECEECAIAKSKQKNLNKEAQERANVKGERLMLDISSINNSSFGGAKYWLLVIDDATDYCWSLLLKSKDELAAKMIELIKELKDKYQVQVKKIRCDNGGENKSFEKLAKEARLGLHFEYTARKTPQQNGRVERKFATLFGRVRSMLNGAKLPQGIRDGLWAECAATATHMENLIVTPNKPQPAHQHFFGEESKFAKELRVFGEVAIVHDAQKIKSKLADRGSVCIFVGYATNHAAKTYRMLNMKTKEVWISRDLKWMNQVYGDYKPHPDDTAPLKYAEEDDDYEDDNLEEDVPKPTPVNAKTLRELRRLNASFNPTAQEVLAEAEAINAQLGRDETVANASIDTEAIDHLFSGFQEFAFYSESNLEEALPADEKPPVVDEPDTFQEAFHHPDPEQREKWRAAIHKEFRDMLKRTVWQKRLRSQIPKNRRCIKSKWVFSIKRDGTYRARIVACGYSQIPGVDFTDNYAPVVNDVTWRIMVIAMLIWGLDAIIIDVETAFLYGNLEEEIYMDLPEGMEGTAEECLLLLKSLYGLVQAARQWWKKFVAILKKLGFKGGYADPCLMIRRNKNGLIIVSIYVDDNFCVGHKKALQEFVLELKEHGLVIKVAEGLKDYLSCSIVVSEDKKKAWIGQPHLIKKLDKKFGELVKNLQSYRTPGTPGNHIVRVQDETLAITADKQALYRSGVGMLLYLVKHSRPCLANPVRELSKTLDKANSAAYKELLRIIKFVLDTRDFGLKIEPKIVNLSEPWSLTVFCDSDYAGDVDSRISVTGFCVFLMGVPVSWKSRSQKSVTLSSSEAEFVALSEAAKEVKFIVQVLLSIGIDVELPVIVRVDNVGAIFLADNVTTSQRTKHIDVRYHYVREFVEDGFVKIVFVRTKENTSDVFTKNTSGDTHDRHSDKIEWDVRDVMTPK